MEPDIKATLEPTEERDEDGGEEEGFLKCCAAKARLMSEVRQDTDGGENKTPENPSGQHGAERVRTPEGGQGKIERKKVEKETGLFGRGLGKGL